MATYDAPFIFISYAHADEAVVRPIINMLDRNGFNVWHDNLDNLQPGSLWGNEIEDAVRHCTVFIPLFSKAYMKSMPCYSEIYLASNANCTIQPVYLEQARLSDQIKNLGVMRFQFLEKYRYVDDQEFYLALFHLQRMNECRLSNEPYVFPKTSFMTSTKRRVGQKVQKNKKRMIRFVVILLILLGLGLTAVLKGPELVASGSDFISSALGNEPEGEVDKGTYTPEADALTVLTATSTEPQTFEARIPAMSTEGSFSFTADTSGTYQLSLDSQNVSADLDLMVTDKSSPVNSISNMLIGQSLQLENLEAGRTYQVTVSTAEATSRAINLDMTLLPPRAAVALTVNSEITDSLTTAAQMNAYEYTVSQENRYLLTIGDNSEPLSFRVDDSDGNRVQDGSCEKGGGTWLLNYAAEPGETYRIWVYAQNDSGTTDYRLQFTSPSVSADLSDYSAVEDTINSEYDQNIYTYTPEFDGDYYFNFDEMMVDRKMQVLILDPYHKEMLNELLGSEEGKTADLEAGTTYTIYVTQSESIGDYTLRIHAPSEPKKLKKNKRDSITYTGQLNTYTFSAKKGVSYHIYITEMSDEQSVQLTAKTEYDNDIRSPSDDEKGGIDTTPLDANGTILIYVQQSTGTGSYRLHIEAIKE